MPDLSARSTKKEIMDDPNAPEDQLLQTLSELAVVNKRLGGHRATLSALKQAHLQGRTSIIDVGSGGGDTLRTVAAWLEKENVKATLTGIDYNPVMTRYAAAHTHNPDITYIEADVFDAQLHLKADIVMCSLFCHHFAHDSLVALLHRMLSFADDRVIINDLHRHWFAYYSIKLLTTLFSKTYVVKNDATLSVARAFTRKDWISTLADAGITNYAIKWKWAFRWLIVIKK